jgi:hypothetical protein
MIRAEVTIYLTLNMDAVYHSESWVTLYQTTKFYIPEHNHIILQHVDLLLGNDREISSYKTAVIR